jgi:hypothetical protein
MQNPRACLSLLGFAFVLLGHLPDASARKEERTRYVELQPMVGYSWVNLTGFSESQFYDSFDPNEIDANTDPNDTVQAATEDGQVPVEGFGPSFGGALQLKLWVFVLGARYSYTHTPSFGLHTLAGDLGLRLGKTVSVYGRLGPGWTIQDGLPPGININGFVISSSGGLDFRLAPALSVGLGLDVDVLLLAKTGQIQAAANAGSGNISAETARELDGSAVGFQFRPQLHFIFHL